MSFPSYRQFKIRARVLVLSSYRQFILYGICHGNLQHALRTLHTPPKETRTPTHEKLHSTTKFRYMHRFLESDALWRRFSQVRVIFRFLGAF